MTARSISANITLFSLLAFFIVSFFSIPQISYSQNADITPENRDGFETGDWRNFRPRYVGDSSEFIRPRFRVSDRNPINGNYSLEWHGGEENHEWVMVSNAFYLARPMTATVDFRTEADTTDWRAGFYLMEDYDHVSGIQIHSGGGLLQSDAADFRIGFNFEEEIVPEEIYRLKLEWDLDRNLKASIMHIESGDLVATARDKTVIEPHAIGFYVQTGEESETILTFDDLSIESGPYYVRSGEWTRSPHFVVLPRTPEITQEEGNWVGAQSVMKTEDGTYKIWYRMRDNVRRGIGYGFATSTYGLNWDKYENNPVFQVHERYASNEKISVLKIDGQYRAWYTVEGDGDWLTVHATSEDGINWENHEEVIPLDQMVTKDPVVIYVDGTYYLYSLGPRYDDISVLTSDDGLNWELQNTIHFGGLRWHMHVAAYYDAGNEEFVVYATNTGLGFSSATSKDGIHFGAFTREWWPPNVGLDDWYQAGLTYLSFLTNEHGHIQDRKYLPGYYQARNTYENNIPSWLYHGGERVVLAGKFDGIYPGIPTLIKPDGTYLYEAFPFEVERARNFYVRSTDDARILVEEWNPDGEIFTSGTIEHEETVQVQWVLKNQQPDTFAEVRINEESGNTASADSKGNILIRTVIDEPGKWEFEILLE